MNEETLAGLEYRKLPAVDGLMRLPSVALLAAEYGAGAVTNALRATLDAARRQIRAGGPAPAAHDWPLLVNEQLAALFAPTLRPVINGTGVIIHTNLGRAPLSDGALAAIQAVAGGYSNLEFELERGERGSRYDHTRTLLAELTGAEDGLVVNNNAAAVFLVLSALAAGREVLISRGQLVEIGGGFRIPDVLRQSGARLVEVGTTNRTHLPDFALAMTPQSAAIMRVHSSNFKQIGFIAMPEPAELAALARAQGLIFIDDLGSGTLLDVGPLGLAHEPTVPESVAAGADLVTFSGDKLLGGPQAGLIVGRRELIAQLRRHPLARALRVDKLTLAALEATLRSYQRGRAQTEIPVWQMMAAPVAALRTRAEAWQRTLAAGGIACEVVVSESTVGGGSLPGEVLPSVALALTAAAPDALAARLRQAEPPVVGRIRNDRLQLDPRTVLPRQDELLLTILRQTLV